MSGRARVAIALFAIAAVVEAVALGFILLRLSWGRAALDTPVQRGRLVAEKMGCFACHGPGGGAPIRNPGARDGEVPGWTGGTWMMWNRDEADVRSWILTGRTPRREPDAGALISMPAYEGRLAAKEVDDLVAYVLAVSNFGSIEDAKAAAGHEVAYRLGCFGCHGPEGRGLVANPGSLKGYVPPWDGPDYPDLVRDDDELAQWIRNGISDRFRANPIARGIVEKQAIVMPAYRDRVTGDDLAAISAYITWVRANPR